MLCALIMAGGKGERFWPLSTDEKPKQFLKLLGEETMLQMTVNRLRKLIPIEQIFVVTGQRYIELVNEQVKDLPKRNIIIEPVGRNTAPCIGLSAFYINKFYKDAVITVVPSDHLISDEEKFIETLESGYEFVKSSKEAVVTIGMEPDRPETGYGYIKCSNVVCNINEHEIKKVENFVEKPDEKKAQMYLKEGNYLWNGGMFIWNINTILKLTKKFLPKDYQVLSEIAAAFDDEYESVLNEKYAELNNISIDYGIMENAENVYVIPGEFGWDDVGTWYSVERVREKDSNGNVCSGEITNIDSNNNILISSNKPIVVVGMDNVFVVESEDIIFIGRKENLKNIKEIKKQIE